MSAYWNEKIETMSLDELRAMQSQRLADTVKRVYENVPYYAQRMKEQGITPEDIKSVDDLCRLPFTNKTDLRDNYPFGTFAVPLDQCIRIHASSGTTGKATVVGYTQYDIDIWSECVARGLTSIGIDNRDIVHVSYGYGLFTGGLGLHDGATRVGATVVPASVGNTARQMTLLKDFGATVLCCTPSYALHLCDALEEAGIKKEELSLRYGVFGAEPWTEEMREEIEKRLNIKAYDIYGLSEIMGPGVSLECGCKHGMHIQADHFIPEIINPETGEVLPDGELGELVFTCITKQALPLIRYRTHDLCRIHSERCECGRIMPRMEKIKGRSDDMLIIRGVNVFPSQIESVILKHAEVEPHYMIYVDRVDNSDTLEIHIEINEDVFSDEVRKIEAIERKVRGEIASVLGISARVKLVEPRSIPRSEGKAQRVIDRRNVYNNK